MLSSLLWFLPLRLLALLSMVQVGLRSLKLLAFFKRLRLHVCLAVLTHLLVLDMLRLLLMHAFTWMPLGCWCCLRVLVLTACTSLNSGVSPASPGKNAPEGAPWVPGHHTRYTLHVE